MKIKKYGKISPKGKLIRRGIVGGAIVVSLVLSVGSSLKDKSTETLPEEITILVHDYQELEDMGKDTSAVEKEIYTRVLLFKREIRKFVEEVIDMPVKIEGDLLVFETTTKEKKEIKEELEITDPDWPKQIGAFEENGISYYYYYAKTVYQLDIDEPSLTALLQFLSSSTDYTEEELLEVIKQYQLAKQISYGYRLAYLTCFDEKANPDENMETTIYTGTVFDNTKYSKQTSELMDKVLLTVKTDYVERTGSTYEPTSYVIRKVDGHWLIIHSETGATDVLNEQEGKLCAAVGQVQLCYQDGLLKNDKDADEQVSMLQQVLHEYFQQEENVKTK